MKKDHDYYYQVQQQLHATKRNYCDLVVCAFSNNSANFICERILPSTSFLETQVPKLSVFWHTCILSEILGRWYTRKLDLTIESSLGSNGECYCQKKTNELPTTCSNPGCLISKFHLSCLAIQKVPKTWYCPHCKKLPEFKLKKSKSAPDDRNKVLAEAIKLENICLCKKMADSNDKLTQCQNQQCPNGTNFHLSCM